MSEFDSVRPSNPEREDEVTERREVGVAMARFVLGRLSNGLSADTLFPAVRINAGDGTKKLRINEELPVTIGFLEELGWSDFDQVAEGMRAREPRVQLVTMALDNPNISEADRMSVLNRLVAVPPLSVYVRFFPISQ